MPHNVSALRILVRIQSQFFENAGQDVDVVSSLAQIFFPFLRQVTVDGASERRFIHQDATLFCLQRLV